MPSCKKAGDAIKHVAGLLLEDETRLPAPVYSAHSTAFAIEV